VLLNASVIVTPFARSILQTLRTAGPLGRHELAQRLGVRPNSVGDAVAAMVKRGLLKEGDARAAGRGRPTRPLSIDPDRRVVLGLAMEPGRVGCCRLNLLGETPEPVVRRAVTSPRKLIAACAALLEEQLDPRVLAVGLSTTGFVDVPTRRVLLSSALPDATSATLDPIFAAAGRKPVVLDNDMHGLAAAWLLAQPHAESQDVLLIDLNDGAVGGALIVAGRPNRGCVVGGNEIGHTRCRADTPTCYCGHRGCLERVYSSPFLGGPGALAARTRDYEPGDTRLREMIDHVAWGLANAVNLVRPARLVLHLPTDTHDDFVRDLILATRRGLLRPLGERVIIERWAGGPDRFSVSAGWLALAALHLPNWPSVS
jgi:predicted NBD/HSP70 family sugar kinase